MRNSKRRFRTLAEVNGAIDAIERRRQKLIIAAEKADAQADAMRGRHGWGVWIETQREKASNLRKQAEGLGKISLPWLKNAGADLQTPTLPGVEPGDGAQA
jgi:hypothetical protein